MQFLLKMINRGLKVAPPQPTTAALCWAGTVTSLLPSVHHRAFQQLYHEEAIIDSKVDRSESYSQAINTHVLQLSIDSSNKISQFLILIPYGRPRSKSGGSLNRNQRGPIMSMQKTKGIQQSDRYTFAPRKCKKMGRTTRHRRLYKGPNRSFEEDSFETSCISNTARLQCFRLMAERKCKWNPVPLLCGGISPVAEEDQLPLPIIPPRQ